MNPVEDEAVVAECLRQSKGSFRLVDPRPYLSGLRFSEGTTNWSLRTKDLTAELHNYDEAKEHMARCPGGFQYRPSMFPGDDLERLNIHFCVRVLPHQQDTGGFFISALECVEDYPESTTPNIMGMEACPFQPVSEALAGGIRKSLGLPHSFPFDRLLVRSESAREQKFYVASQAAMDLLRHLNARVVHIGAKVIESYAKYSNDKLRFSMDGLSTLAMFLPEHFFVDCDVHRAHCLLRGLRTTGENGNGDDNFSVESLYRERSEPIPPHSFIVRTTLTDGLGPVLIHAERERPIGGAQSSVSLKAPDWMVTLITLSCGFTVSAEESLKDGEGDNSSGEAMGGQGTVSFAVD
jgi:hypothetical protein